MSEEEKGVKKILEDWIDPESREENAPIDIDSMYPEDDIAIARCDSVMRKCYAKAIIIVEENRGSPEFAWPVAIGMFNTVTQNRRD